MTVPGSITTRFTVRGQQAPDFLARVTAPFSVAGMNIHRACMRLATDADEVVVVELDVLDMPDSRASTIAERLRGYPPVIHVRVDTDAAP
jgi:hypothetical protein